MGYYYYDWTIILVIIGAGLSMLASLMVQSTYARYKKAGNKRGYTAEQVAEEILRSAGINNVSIQRIAGDLTDHYSPNEKILRLSDSVYGSSSVAAIGVAAHECGHAIQDQVDYGPLRLRAMSVPLANIGSRLSFPLIIFGLIIGATPFVKLGILLFCLVVFFQVITLPVEFDASRRALKVLRERNILYDKELSGARKVLLAAALTYVAAVISSLLQLLRLILISNSRRR